jgi:hypothetical protein
MPINLVDGHYIFCRSVGFSEVFDLLFQFLCASNSGEEDCFLECERPGRVGTCDETDLLFAHAAAQQGRNELFT